MRRRAIARAVVAGIAGAIVAAACSLGLDESLLDQPIGAGGAAGKDAQPPDGPAGTDADAAAEPQAEADAPDVPPEAPSAKGCDADPQCAIDAGCYQGRCDKGTAKCVYSLCPGSATSCTAKACETPDGAPVCGPAAAYFFHARKIDIDGRVGCGGSAARCFATVGPWAVVATETKILAWDVTNPLSPDTAAIAPPPFGVSRIAASGSRLLLIGPVASGKLSLAWVDFPILPKDTAQPTSVAVQYAHPAVSGAYAAGPGTFLFVYNDAGLSYPAAVVPAAIPANLDLKMYPSSGIPAGSVPVASSGARLVTYRVDTANNAYAPYASFVNQAGTPGAQAGNEWSLVADTDRTTAGATFSTSDAGAVLWTAGRVEVPDSGSPYVKSARFFWIVADSAATTFSGSSYVDLETYAGQPLAPGDTVAGPSAAIDGSTALATAALPQNPSQTSVRVVKKQGQALSVDQKQFSVAVGPANLGVRAAAGFGLVLTPPTTKAPEPPDTALHVFAPTCASN